MSLTIEFSPQIDFSHSIFNEKNQKEKYELFLQTISSPDVGFFRLEDQQKMIEKCENIYQTFSDRKYFVHIGIGGSSLGPEMLISALETPGQNTCQFFFINNIDPDYINDILSQIKIKQSIFYFVSKSGGTAETLAALTIMIKKLNDLGIKEENFGQYFVFATDPLKGDLRELSKKWNIHCLDIPPNIGGRYSVLTPVGYFPALFAGINPIELWQGAEKFKSTLLHSDLKENILLKTAATLTYLKDNHQISQTVLMPYSSKLRQLSLWFVQLWAESLGKKFNQSQHIVHQGLTPIASYGATDQHSQLQLFMEGPKDKCILFIEIENFTANFELNNLLEPPAFKKLSPYTLSELFKAELEGTIAGLKQVERPFLKIKIGKITPETLASLILFFESLTALMGHYLQINPFDQPGVEASKIFAYKWLQK